MLRYIAFRHAIYAIIFAIDYADVFILPPPLPPCRALITDADTYIASVAARV